MEEPQNPSEDKLDVAETAPASAVKPASETVNERAEVCDQESPEPAPLVLAEAPPEPAPQPEAAPAPVASAKTETKRSGGGDDDKKRHPRVTLLSRVRMVVWELTKIVIIVLLLRAYVIQASTVDGDSMNPTLHGREGVDQDYLLVERFTATMQNLPALIQGAVPEHMMPQIKRGDIVVLASPENASNELVKRVMAIEGDYIFFFENELYINGVPERELDYLPKNVSTEHASSDIPNNTSQTLQFFDKDEMDDRKLERDREGKRFAAALRRLGSSEELIKRVLADGGTAEYRKIGVQVPKDCVVVVGDNRGAGQSNDSRKWLDIRVNHSDDERHLWAMRQQIHGRVIARLKLPWEYDATHPLIPE